MRTGIDGSGAERLAFEILAIGAGYAPLVPAAVRGARDPSLRPTGMPGEHRYCRIRDRNRKARSHDCPFAGTIP